MRKIFTLLGMLLLGIISYAKEEDILFIKERKIKRSFKYGKNKKRKIRLYKS